MKAYALDEIRKRASDLAVRALGQGCEGKIRVEFPPPGIDADLALPLFSVSKKLRKNPQELAQEVIEKTDTSGTIFSELSAEKGFVNFRLDWRKCNKLFFEDFLSAGDAYGKSDVGRGRTVVIDYSSPNIAKPFSVGHLRSTVIGQALYNIFTFLGYRVIGDNHIGDWGTQFGKLLAAYVKWGSETALEQAPTRALLDLYVRFHDEAEEDPALESEAREWFAKLEAGDEEAASLWKRFRDLSLREFERIYDLLGVGFDCTLGESFYNDKLPDVVEQAMGAGIARWSLVPAKEEGAEVDGEVEEQEKVVLIPLESHGIRAPLILQKSDGTSLYATRDIATLKYRIEKWKPSRVLYVVGAEQRLYFSQLFKAFELLGIDAECVHVAFGLIRLPEGRMSTRKGRVIFLEDLLDEAVERARSIVQERDMAEDEKEAIARLVGVGAVKYADLSQDRTKDVVFDWKKMLALEGNSGPYLQYAYTRAASIIRKSGESDLTALREIDPGILLNGEETALIWEIAKFPEVIRQSANDYKPHYIANYLFALSQAFNRFYVNNAVLRAETPALRESRLALVGMVAHVLRRGLGLLGIECPEKM
jgi:arginyl-tRNA synthetase